MVLIHKFHLRRWHCQNSGKIIWQYYYLYTILLVVGYVSNIKTTLDSNYSSILVTAYLISNNNNNQYQNYFLHRSPTSYIVNDQSVYNKKISFVCIRKHTGPTTVLEQKRSSNRNSLFQEEEEYVDYTGYYFDEDNNDYYEDKTKVTSEQRRRERVPVRVRQSQSQQQKEIPVKDRFSTSNDDEFDDDDDDYDTTDRNSINNNNNGDTNEEYNINIQQRQQQQKRKLQSSSVASQQQKQQQKQQQRQFREPISKNIVDERIINRSTNDVSSSIVPISSSVQERDDSSSRTKGQSRQQQQQSKQQQQNSRKIEHDFELDEDDDDDDNYDIDDDDVDDMYYNDDDDDDDTYSTSNQNSVSSPSTGNFWSNPVGTVDDDYNKLILPKKRRTSTQNRDQTPLFPKYSIASASSMLPFMNNNNNDNIQNNRIQQQQQSKRTTFRSGSSQPPNPVLELYNNLFWYGFDPTDTISPSDPTMFGGTKGKFNGLSYLYDGEATIPDEYRPRRRTRPRQNQQQQQNQQVEYDDDDDDDEFYDIKDDIDDDDNDKFVNQIIERRSDFNKRKIQPVVTPPYDPPLPVVMSMRNKEENGRRRIPRQSTDSNNKRRPRYDEEYDADYNYDNEDNTSRRRRDNTNDNGDWVVNEVSNWFRTDRIDKRNYDSRNSRKDVPVDGRRKRSIAVDDDSNENDDPWQTITYAFDAFLGINRDQLKRKAVQYDNQMGISTVSSSSTTPVQRKRRRRPPQRLDNDDENTPEDNRQRSRRQQQDDDTNTRIRPGFTYRYEDVNNDDDDESNDTSDIIDADPILVEDDEPTELDQTSSTRRDRQTRRKIEENDQDVDSNNNQRTNDEKMTWEQRALAMERVPPGNVPAWGPTGDLGIDARTKGLSDALEDIADAKYTIEQYQKKIIQYKEEMTILRVDNQLERKRLARYVSSINNNNNIDPVLYESTIEQMNEQIRRIDKQIDTTSRSLRYEKMKLQSAKDELDDIETRHWALLRYYNPNLAKDIVDDALRELEQVEPAVRSIRDRSNTKMKEEE